MFAPILDWYRPASMSAQSGFEEVVVEEVVVEEEVRPLRHGIWGCGGYSIGGRGDPLGGGGREAT